MFCFLSKSFCPIDNRARHDMKLKLENSEFGYNDAKNIASANGGPSHNCDNLNIIIRISQIENVKIIVNKEIRFSLILIVVENH